MPPTGTAAVVVHAEAAVAVVVPSLVIMTTKRMATKTKRMTTRAARTHTTCPARVVQPHMASGPPRVSAREPALPHKLLAPAPPLEPPWVRCLLRGRSSVIGSMSAVSSLVTGTT